MEDIKYGQLWARHSELVEADQVGTYYIPFHKFKKAIEEAVSILQPTVGPVWVKASERLPGYETPVKWRDGKDHSHATDGKIPLIHMAKPFLTGWEWYDESGTTATGKPYDDLYCLAYSTLAKLRARTREDRILNFAPSIRNLIDEVTKQMQAMPQPDNSGFENPLTQSRADFIREANSRDTEGVESDAVAFAEWCAVLYRFTKQGWEDDDGLFYTSAQLYAIFKQQKDK